jgi:hypothetical protein
MMSGQVGALWMVVFPFFVQLLGLLFKLLQLTGQLF